MVVDGALGVLFRHAVSWSHVQELRNGPVILDMTHSLYWFTRRLMLTSNQMDLYGCSMVEYGGFFRNFIQHLLARNVTPIIVYEGSRLSEAQYGDIVSKSRIMAQSCRHAMDRLNAFREGPNHRLNFRHQSFLPDLAANALKEVVNELQLEFVIQSRHEVYPVLEQLARERNCPVITSHADFIFYDVPSGFVWLNVIQLPANKREPFTCRLFKHQKMMDHYNLMLDNDCLSLRTLFVFLRTDFREKYYTEINRVLGLEGPLELTENLQDGMLTRRLEHILESWVDNLDLVSFGTIRSALIDQNPGNSELLRDFDMIYHSFTTYEGSFETSDCMREFPHCDLNEAFTNREATAEFLLNLHSTLNNRPGIEDTHLFRSTFSLHDNCRQHLMSTLQIDSVRIFDRSYDELLYRTLSARGSGQPLDREALFSLFHFDSRRLRSVSRELVALGLDPTNSGQLALVLMLANFGYELMYREHHGNDGDDDRNIPNSPNSRGSLSNDSGLGSVRLSPTQQRDRFREAELERRKLFTAIVNSHIHHSKKMRSNKSSRVADIRVAFDKLHQIARLKPRLQPRSQAHPHIYYRLKHMVEMLNSVLHGYIELNSLYEYPGPKLYICKHFDCVLIYKIMSGWSNTLQGYLIRLHGQQLDQMISPTIRRHNDNSTIVPR